MSMPPNSGKYAYCAASHADGRSIPAHRQRRQPETRRLPAIGWSACGGKPETVRSKGFSNGVYLRLPRSCAGVARDIQLLDAMSTAHHSSLLARAVVRLGREGTSGGVGGVTHNVAKTARHPGTRPGQPKTEGG